MQVVLPWQALASTRTLDDECGRVFRTDALGIEVGVQVQVGKLSTRLKEREEQLSEAQDCYSKLDALYQAERADNSAALSSKV